MTHCILAGGNEQFTPLFVVGTALLMRYFPFSFNLPFDWACLAVSLVDCVYAVKREVIVPLKCVSFMFVS